MESKKKSVRRIFIRADVVLLALVVMYVLAEFTSHLRVALPAHVKTVQAYLLWRPDSDRFILHRVNNNEYLEILGPPGGLLPSGPAGYVFDRMGALIDRTSDSGDDSEYQRTWRNEKGKDIDRQQAEQWIQENGSTKVAG